jgi:sugar O-acyltransferase (sialic acid O-acetyltransferase NeuD family)
MGTKASRTAALVGYGTLGRLLEEMLREARLYRRFIRFDDRAAAAGVDDCLPFVEHLDARHARADFFVCLGYHHLPEKRRIIRRLERSRRRLPPFVHERAWVSPNADLGAGALLFPGAQVGAHARIGTGALLHDLASVSHDSVIGAAAFLGPGAIVCGFAQVGEATFLGAGSRVSNGIRVGQRCRVAIGSVVTRDIGDARSAAGHPLRLLRDPLKLR